MTEVMVAVVAAITGAVVTYPVGVRQGKRQLRHESAVSALTEIRRLLLEVRAEFQSWLSDIPDYKDEEAITTGKKIEAVRRCFEERRIVLDSKVQKDIEAIIDRTNTQRTVFITTLRVAGLADDEEKQRNDRYKAGVEMTAWLENTFSTSLEKFEKRLRKLVGSS